MERDSRRSQTRPGCLTHRSSSIHSAHAESVRSCLRRRMRKPSLLVIFLTVFIDLVGFGIVLPLLPVYSDQFGASGLVVGLIMASFSAVQFVFAPAWGRLSDRIGRRPVLLISTAGAAGSYVLFGLGSGVTSAA